MTSQTTITYDSSGYISEIVEYFPPNPNRATRENRTAIEYDSGGNITHITEYEYTNLYEQEQIDLRRKIARSLPGVF